MGLRPPVLVADAGYGEVGEFRQGLDDRGIGYVVQVKADTSAYPEQVRPPPRPPPEGAAALGRATATSPARSSSSPWPPASPPVWSLIWRRGSKGLQRSRFLALRVRPAGITPRRQAAARADGAGWELPTRWLLVEWPTDKPEPIKYWLSNLPEAPRWWSWSGWASCAGESNRITGN